jgi:hypothetical protein
MEYGGCARLGPVLEKAVLRIRDVNPRSEFFSSQIPDPGSKKFRIPDSQLRISFFLTLKFFSKLSAGSFLPIPDPRSRGQKARILDPDSQFTEKKNHAQHDHILGRFSL